MTRNGFLKFLGLLAVSLILDPLRAFAAGWGLKPADPHASPEIIPIAEMQPRAKAPPGPVTPITPNHAFYVEDIHGPPKHLQPETWRLKVHGNIRRPLNLSLDDILKRPPVHQTITLSCIGNPVGGYALGNAEWRGISLRSLLEEADPGLLAERVIFKGDDGYDDSISLSRARHPGALLAYAMNGEPLPREHGFPLRLLVPGLYGIKQVKWIREIEISNQSHKGYWQKRNWSGNGRVKIISRIDFPRNDGWILENRIVAQGIAFAGDRGIQYVQVSTDGERTWSLARLEQPLSPYTWVFWSFPMELPRSGRYQLAVRAADQYSGIQRDDGREPFPAGTSGIHRIQFNVYHS